MCEGITIVTTPDGESERRKTRVQGRKESWVGVFFFDFPKNLGVSARLPQFDDETFPLPLPSASRHTSPFLVSAPSNTPRALFRTHRHALRRENHREDPGEDRKRQQCIALEAALSFERVVSLPPPRSDSSSPPAPRSAWRPLRSLSRVLVQVREEEDKRKKRLGLPPVLTNPSSFCGRRGTPAEARATLTSA